MPSLTPDPAHAASSGGPAGCVLRSACPPSIRRAGCRGPQRAMRLVLATLVMLAAALSLPARGEQPADPAAAPLPIVFLGDRDLAPYEFLVNGVPRGANVDLIQAVGRVLGRPVEVRLMDWAQAQAQVLTGGADALTLLAQTPERDREFDFTQPTLPVEFALFVRNDALRSLREEPLPAALQDKRIAVTGGGLARRLLEETYPGARFVIVENLLDGTRRLVGREVDAFGAQVWSQKFLLTELGLRSVTALPPFAARAGNMAVREGNAQLRADLDRALTQLKASGEFDRIIERWTSTRLQLVSEATIVAMATAASVAATALVLLSLGLLWSRRQKAALLAEVAERRKAEQALLDSQRELQEAARHKDRFIATLAHELRNPLAPISNAVQLLDAGGRQAGYARAVIDRQTRHLTRLIDDLLDVGRISSGKLELRRAPVRLAEVIEDAVESSRPAIDPQRHALEIVQPPGDVWIDVDRARVVQVLMNLLTNAAKYTPGRGRILLTAVIDGSDLHLQVADAGLGIAAAQLPQVFEMFFQEDRSRPHARGGLGIGLWLTRQLVQMHGGTIRAHSDGLDRGTRFDITLPAACCPDPPAAATPSRVPLAGGRRVLVIDDNVDSAESTALLLQALGYEAQAAFDGRQGLALAERMAPQLVLLDLGMPGLSGYDVCRRLRAGGQPMTIVAITGWGAEADRAATVAAGFDGHLVKPIVPTALQDMLAALPATP